jgi:hypothetical protein
LQFDGTIGSGEYRSASLSKEVSDRFHFEVQAGDQLLRSGFVEPSRSRFGTASADWFIARFVLGASGMRYRGGGQNYDQVLLHLDYRF